MTAKKKTPGSEIVTLAVPPVSAASGDTFSGQYTLVELYGAGPLGHAYRARDASGGSVAVKVIARELFPTGHERQNLVNEISKLAGREMPNIAVPLDAGIEGPIAFVVTAWVRGRSLRRVLGAYRDAGRVMPNDEIFGVLEGVVQALRQLHTVAAHGALYPESVQIGANGQIVLTDAGIASAASRARLIDHFERFPDVMPYLSPEIRGGKASSAGSDLFALGALASELLTGDPGAAAAGIAGPMLHGLPREIDTALRGLVALKSSKRAAALPMLLGSLARSVRDRSMPSSTTLPTAKQRTELHLAAPHDPSRGGGRKRRGP